MCHFRALPSPPHSMTLENTWATIITEDRMTEHERVGSEIDLEAIDSVQDAHVATLNAGDDGWIPCYTCVANFSAIPAKITLCSNC
jgi:hypothetical protein